MLIFPSILRIRSIHPPYNQKDYHDDTRNENKATKTTCNDADHVVIICAGKREKFSEKIRLKSLSRQDITLVGLKTLIHFKF